MRCGGCISGLSGLAWHLPGALVVGPFLDLGRSSFERRGVAWLLKFELKALKDKASCLTGPEIGGEDQLFHPKCSLPLKHSGGFDQFYQAIGKPGGAAPPAVCELPNVRDPGLIMMKGQRCLIGHRHSDPHKTSRKVEAIHI